MSFLDMSLMGGAMILCILLLRMLSRNRLPGAVLSAMWVAALLRLLVPVEIPSALSVAGLVKRSGQTAAMALPARTMPGTMHLSPLVIVWLCGAALCFLFFLFVGIKQKRVLKTALPASMTPVLKSALIQQHLLGKAAVYTSDRISTPLTYGFIKPRIILPSSIKLSGQELNFVMAHEGGHILRRDAAKKCFLLFTVCLHWFNPLVWLMAEVCRRDMEMNCDRRVLKSYGSNARSNYARTLLNLEERKRFSGILIECFSKSPLEERIRSIMTGKKSSVASILAAIAVYGCAAAAFATSPGMQPTVKAGTVSITAIPAAMYDTLQANTSATAVYVMSGDVLASGQTGFKMSAPFVSVSSATYKKTLPVTSTSVSGNHGDIIVVATDPASASSNTVPVYSMTYTIKDMN